ncbi:MULTISPECIES: glycyl-tRNA synthetase subunit alpha [unclassified Mannheimia]|uniref:glycyl-tRNA synthetase subunit alpha n=1 Tax=Pasteurellaceae TaxID=712 RepID=UPI00359DDD4E
MNYWLVGAKWGGSEEALDIFLKRGYWYCWDIAEDDFPTESFKGGNSIARQLSSFKDIEKNDRIAVKRLCGQGSAEMRILAIGVVKDVCFEEHRIYINWIAVSSEVVNDPQFNDIELPTIHFEERRVELGGCVSSIHGPYSLHSEYDKDWLQKIFYI